MEFEKRMTSFDDEIQAARSLPAFGRRGEPPIEIAKGIPTPTRGRAKYPFRSMQLGDSFFAPRATVIGLHGCARRHRPMRFTCRTVVEQGVPGVRVWRIA